jgi:hypothetical protein
MDARGTFRRCPYAGVAGGLGQLAQGPVEEGRGLVKGSGPWREGLGAFALRSRRRFHGGGVTEGACGRSSLAAAALQNEAFSNAGRVVLGDVIYVVAEGLTEWWWCWIVAFVVVGGCSAACGLIACYPEELVDPFHL